MDTAHDLYLRGAFEMHPSATAPGPAAALDILLRLSYQMQDTPFQYCFVDKPRFVFHDPGRPHWPSDGIRYLSQAHDGAGEKFSVSAHALPNNVAGQAELETGVVTGGIFPPSNPAIPLSKDSPDLQLARYRIRWRIKTQGLGNPALWLVYWGRDERATQRAPAGWEREVIRRYPLPVLPSDTPAQQPLQTGEALPPPLLVEPAYPAASASPPPHMLQQQHLPRHPSQTPYQQQHHPPLPLNLQQPPPIYPMYHQGRQQSMSAGPPPGSSQGMPQQQPLPLQIQHHQQQQQPQTRRNTPKQSHAAITRKPPPPGLGKPGSTPQAQQHQTIAAATQPQINALQAIPHHMRAAVGASPAHASFPQGFSDPYDYLSSRSWAALRYERNHAVVSPLFDPSTTTEIMESWIVPSFPDLEKIKEEISLLQKEVEVLKAHQAQLPGKALFTVSTLHAGNDASTATSQQLARKTSLASGVTGAGKDMTRQRDLDALLAPLPRMMPITEMHDKAMQAHNARRKEIEDALQAQRRAKEEEERIERERKEAEEAAKRAAEEEARQKDRKEREAQQQAEWERRKEEGKVKQEGQGDDPATYSTKIKTSSTLQPEGSQQFPQPAQYAPAARPGDSTNNTSRNTSVYGEEATRTENGLGGAGGGAGGENYFDDSYNLLMDNFNMYENNGTGFTMPGDEMMDDSLFSEYMDQMGSM